MWPWGHAAVGYLLYSAYVRAGFDSRPAGPQVLALAVGTQLPDLVDKPLAWQFHVLPNGRSVGHSLLVFALVVLVAWLALQRTSRDVPLTAFGIGYLSHLLGDGLYPFLDGEFHALGYLAYPLVPPIEYDVLDAGFIAIVLSKDFGVTGYVELGLALVAIVLWYVDGMPGVRLLVPGRFLKGDEDRSDRR